MGLSSEIRISNHLPASSSDFEWLVFRQDFNVKRPFNVGLFQDARTVGKPSQMREADGIRVVT